MFSLVCLDLVPLPVLSLEGKFSLCFLDLPPEDLSLVCLDLGLEPTSFMTLASSKSWVGKPCVLGLTMGGNGSVSLLGPASLIGGTKY